MNADADGTAAGQEEPSFYRLPALDWSAVDPAVLALLATLARDLQATLAALPAAGLECGVSPDTAGAAVVLTPAALALRMGEVAGQVFGAVVGEEGDLRQVISTLRTALALCWDMYSADETGRVTVRQHMDRLRASIADFEEDLQQVQDLESEG